VDTPEYAKINKDSDNQSVLIVGRSGSGKTYALKKIENGIAHSEGAVLVLNYHGTHADLFGDDGIYWIDASKEGIPLSLLSPMSHPDGSWENKAAVMASLVDVFCNVSRLEVRQKKALREAAERAGKRGDAKDNEVWAIGEELFKANCKEADTVYEKFYEVFTQGKVSLGKPLFEKGKITVVDLDKFTEQAQGVLAEMVLSFLWRYFHIWGQYAKMVLYIVADEFQALPLRRKTIFSKVLREGRKYNIALLLATQTLSDLKMEDKAMLQQAATQMYFRPAAVEVKDITKALNPDPKVDAKKLLLSLQKGECVATGRFTVGQAVIERPLKMTFRDGDGR